MYANELLSGAVVPGSAAMVAPSSLGSVAVIGEILIGTRIKINMLKFIVTTVTVGAATVRFSNRITPGSDTGAIVLGTLTIPAATPVGKVLYKAITPAVMSVGDSLKCEVTANATSGAGMYLFEGEQDPEAAANEADMILSA